MLAMNSSQARERGWESSSVDLAIFDTEDDKSSFVDLKIFDTEDSNTSDSDDCFHYIEKVRTSI
jgi:hypothetical protein